MKQKPGHLTILSTVYHRDLKMYLDAVKILYLGWGMGNFLILDEGP